MPARSATRSTARGCARRTACSRARAAGSTPRAVRPSTRADIRASRVFRGGLEAATAGGATPMTHSTALKIAPSILSADFAELRRRGRGHRRRRAPTGSIVDVMDGHFVPNITFGPPLVQGDPRRASTKVFDVPPDDRAGRPLSRGLRRGRRRHHHRPCRGRPASRPHAAGDPRRSARRPASRSTPATPEERRRVRARPGRPRSCVMTVNPGFGGQTFIPARCEKMRRCAR